MYVPEKERSPRGKLLLIIPPTQRTVADGEAIILKVLGTFEAQLSAARNVETILLIIRRAIARKTSPVPVATLAPITTLAPVTNLICKTSNIKPPPNTSYAPHDI